MSLLWLEHDGCGTPTESGFLSVDLTTDWLDEELLGNAPTNEQLDNESNPKFLGSVPS